jgi:lysophospholipase L1-like esterase
MLDGTELLELDGKRRMIKEYAAAVVEVAESEGVNYVDHYSLWMNSMRSKYAGEMMLLMGNCMHPNGNGHRRFYHELAPVLGLEAEFQHEFSHLLSKAAAGE